ncbi:MAG TPA: response regulator [Spirochaetes bacterium]|nr:response regulator [Spirochaetota bacterium]
MPDKLSIDYLDLLEAIPGAVIVVDKNKMIVAVNRYTRRIYRDRGIEGRPCDEVFSQCSLRNNGCPVEALDFVLPSGTCTLRQKMLVEGAEENVAGLLIPAAMEGNPSEYLFMHVIQDRDFFAREKLVELEKNLTMTTLTAGIAHEFNNMNAGIQGLVELIMSQNSLSRDTARDMGTIMKIVKRAGNLIDQLLIYSNRKSSRKVLVGLDTVVENCVKILRPELAAKGVEVETACRLGAEQMFIDENRISLALMNIIINARDAVVDSDEKKIRVETGRDGERAYIKVTDTGSGIDPDHLGRIFEPFFTTKGALGSTPMDGTGLGLSVAAGVLKEHKGAVDVQSAPGEGSVFTLWLPCAPSETLESAVSRVKGNYDLKGSRILVADDEAELNDLLRKALVSRNADAHSVYSGSEALEALEKAPYDLVLLDVQMRDMNGWDVIRKMPRRKKRPGIIVISGNFLVINAEESREVEKVLLKPFDLDDLYQAASEVLALKKNK